MVYGYNTNKEFIDKSYQLLGKLDKKHLWDKDTLVIGLDKSVRPLAYTLKKISDLEKKKTPDIRFFNYSVHNYSPISCLGHKQNVEEISNRLINKLNTNKFSKYKNILILDEHISSGQSLIDVEKILKNYFLGLNPKVNISFAYLGHINEIKNPEFDKKKSIYVQNQMIGNKAESEETGIEDKYKYSDLEKSNLKELIRVKNKATYKEFLQNRKQLSEDIKNYVAKKQERTGRLNLLEKIVQYFSLLLLISGLFIGYKGITGNVIGNSSSINVLGIILIILGLLGLFLSKK